MKDKQPFVLFDYQPPMIAETVRILTEHRVVYLMAETRVGKTSVSILAAQTYIDEKQLDHEIVFVTKAGVMSDIEGQIVSLQEAGLLHRPVKVVSVDSLHKLTWKLGTIFIVDEAHSLGAYPLPSKRAVMMREICRMRPVILLSATPTPETTTMLFHQFWAVGCEHLFGSAGMNFWQFAAKFTDPYVEEKRGRLIKNYSRAKWNLIQPLISSHCVSRTKADAGFKFTDVETTIYRCPMPEYVKSAIDELSPPRRKKGDPEPPETRSTVIDGHLITVRSPAEIVSKIHQLCSGTVIDNKDERIIVSTHKIALVDRALHEFGKVAVYYKFIAEADMLRLFYGDRLTEDAQEFEKDSGKIFIGQFQSKREGIDLSSAGALVFFNIDYAYLSYEQTKNRIQNYKRTTQPHIVLLFTVNGIEERIFKVVQSKKKYTTQHYFRGH